MLTLLFAVCFWLGLVVAACGAVVWLGFAWFLIDDWLHPVEAGPMRVPAPRRVPPRAVTPCHPFDQDDPLERQFALPCAPDPRVR